MSENLRIDPGRTAVLIMDYQTDILGFLGASQQDLLKRASKSFKRHETLRLW